MSTYVVGFDVQYVYTVHDACKVSTSISLFLVYSYFCFGVDAWRDWSYSYGQARSKTDLQHLIQKKELQHLDHLKKKKKQQPISP